MLPSERYAAAVALPPAGRELRRCVARRAERRTSSAPAVCPFFVDASASLTLCTGSVASSAWACDNSSLALVFLLAEVRFLFAEANSACPVICELRLVLRASRRPRCERGLVVRAPRLRQQVGVALLEPCFTERERLVLLIELVALGLRLVLETALLGCGTPVLHAEVLVLEPSLRHSLQGRLGDAGLLHRICPLRACECGLVPCGAALRDRIRREERHQRERRQRDARDDRESPLPTRRCLTLADQRHLGVVLRAHASTAPASTSW